MQEQCREGAASEYAFVEYGTLRKKGLRIVFPNVRPVIILASIRPFRA